jgi:hypothetical protein
MEVLIIAAIILALLLVAATPSLDYRVIPSKGPGEVRFDGRSFRRVFRTSRERAQWMEDLKTDQKRIIEELEIKKLKEKKATYK